MRTVLLNWKCRYFNPHLPLEFHLLHASIDFFVPLPIEKSAIKKKQESVVNGKQ